MSKTFVIACGGTGGHLSPGIALAERLTGLGHRCVLIVSRKKIDARLLEKYPHIEFLRAPGGALVFSPAGILKFVASQFSAVIFALGFLLKDRPVAFVSFGGFMTLGMALACRALFVPVILHEANRIPGKAVRWISRIATRVYLPPGVRVAGLSPRRATEFSFLLGLITLSAASIYKTLQCAEQMRDSFGFGVSAVGLGVAFVAAFASVKWMVEWISRHGLSAFAWYRFALAAAVLWFMA